tara:strand:- start:170 stop:517 length:348 start_codon:yes stop_codon:yes gene_type:complete
MTTRKKIDFIEYQKLSRRTAVYPNIGNNLYYPALGLAGETGEVMNKIKKIMRDKLDIKDKNLKEMIENELGDILWYISNLATELNLSLDDIAKKNLDKLMDRKKRGKIHGSGDNR